MQWVVNLRLKPDRRLVSSIQLFAYHFTLSSHSFDHRLTKLIQIKSSPTIFVCFLQIMLSNLVWIFISLIVVVDLVLFARLVYYKDITFYTDCKQAAGSFSNFQSSQMWAKRIREKTETMRKKQRKKTNLEYLLQHFQIFVVHLIFESDHGRFRCYTVRLLNEWTVKDYTNSMEVTLRNMHNVSIHLTNAKQLCPAILSVFITRLKPWADRLI